MKIQSYTYPKSSFLSTEKDMNIIVDHIIGNHQTVIKPLGKLFKRIEGLSGSTILGDGSVALILDIFKLSDIIRKMDLNTK